MTGFVMILIAALLVSIVFGRETLLAILLKVAQAAAISPRYCRQKLPEAQR